MRRDLGSSSWLYRLAGRISTEACCLVLLTEHVFLKCSLSEGRLLQGSFTQGTLRLTLGTLLTNA